MAVDIGIYGIVSSMSQGDGEGMITEKSSTQVSGRYFFLDWEKAERSARNFSGDPEMKKAIRSYTLPPHSWSKLTICESPSIIVDKRRLKAIGFVFKNGQKEQFLLNDNLVAFRLKDDVQDDVFGRYKEVVDGINASLASLCAKISNKAFALPGMWHNFNDEEIELIIKKLILGRQQSVKSTGDENPPCLEPVKGVDLKPYLDAMEEKHFLEKAGKNRYRKTSKISYEALVLFIYLMNDKIAKKYEAPETTDYEKKLLKRWYEEKSWCGEKPDKPGQGFDNLEEWRHQSDRIRFKSLHNDDIEIIVSGTRTMRTRYFSRLLSINDKQITKFKSTAVEDETNKNEYDIRKVKEDHDRRKSKDEGSYLQVWTKGKRALVLDVVFRTDRRLGAAKQSHKTEQARNE